MHEPAGLFNLVIVAGVVGYQILKAWRKKAATPAPRPVQPVLAQSKAEPSWWEPEASPVPEPVPEPATLPQSAPFLKSTPLHKTAIAMAAGPANEPAATERPIAYKPIAALSQIPTDPTPRAPETVLPALRDLVLAQAILSPPPGLRGGVRAGRSPLELRR
jgi:hypothetical protein